MFFQNKSLQSENFMQSKKGKVIFAVALMLLLIAQLAVLIFYGTKKSGFHEDEFYSYYTTNKTAGLFVNDRTWVERDEFRNDFVVLPGEEFRYDVVKQMQSWDVHPPFYYYLLHTVCSLSTEVFSKWQGITVNLIGFVPCFFLLFYLVWTSMTAGSSLTKGGAELAGGKVADGKKVLPDGTVRNRALYFAFATCLFWGFGAAVISGVMFIRMYQWLTLFILLCACMHVKALKEDKFGISFFVPLAITVFFGFLTQYYYIIFHFFLGAGFCVLLLKRKKIKAILLYGVSCGVGFATAVLYYPASMSHIFRGYRGTEAVSEFSNASNTLDRLNFFTGLFDDYVMNGSLSVFLLCICLLWLTVSFQKKRAGGKQAVQKADREMQIAGLLLFACLGYFFTISKTALLLGETSNRYQLPIYGILIFLLLYYLITPVFRLLENPAKQAEKKEDGAETKSGAANWKRTAGVLLLAVLLFLDVAALRSDKVFFLYEEEKPMMEFAKENSDVPVVVFYNDASPDNVWRVSDQLMEFPQIYLASQGNGEAITDQVITESDKLLVYVADYDNPEKCLTNLLQSNTQLSEYHEIAKKGLWMLYEME